MTDLNPQREQMADESMVRNLAAQAQAIWPQEVHLVRRYGLPPDIRVLDAGCGTGEVSWRLAELFPLAKVLGVDILDHHLAYARDRYASFAPRLTFEHQSVFELKAADANYDLTVCRHVMQAVPHVDRLLAELRRVTKPGGVVHAIAEDYGMMHFPDDAPGAREFWDGAPQQFARSQGVDASIGRHAYRAFRAAGFEEITVDYVIVDTLRVPRETMAGIYTAWRDGYAAGFAEHTRWSEPEARAAFDASIAAIRDPERYAVWFVPVVAGRVPQR